ncbi:MAG: hypothetical protein FWE38_00830 [Firmicutes bacterium]|nr:hypothetical protein [Bacillota bacterium]
MEPMEIVALGLLGLFLLAVAFGLLWGTIRGFKRSLIRLGTIVVAGVLALFLSPVVARMLVGISLPIGEDGESQTIDDTINNMRDDNEVLDSMFTNFTGISDFASALPVAIISLVTFIIMFIALRFLTWIVYAILARVFAPRRVRESRGRTRNGAQRVQATRIPPRRGLGALVGVVQGLVVFFFIMIPINGLLSIVDEIDSYVPPEQYRTVSAAYLRENVFLNEDVNNMAGVYELVADFNADVNDSIYGTIIRFTGIRALSGPMFGYLTTVRMPNSDNISLRRDAVEAISLHRDLLTILRFMPDEVDRTNGNGTYEDEDEPFGGAFGEMLKDLPAEYFGLMRFMVRKLFDLGMFALIAGEIENLADFIEDAELLYDEDGNPAFEFLPLRESEEDPDDRPEGWVNPNVRFNAALMNAIREMDVAFLRDDLMLPLVNILQLLFNETRTLSDAPDAEQYNLANAFGGLMDREDTDTGHAADVLRLFTTAPAGQTPVMEQFLEAFFSLGLFTRILTDENPGTSDLVRLPLQQILGMQGNELNFALKWDSVPYDINRIMNLAVDAFVGLDILLESDNILDALTSNEFYDTINSIGQILNILTREIGLSSNFRSLIVRFIEDQEFDFDLGIGTAGDGEVSPVQQMMNDIADRLRPDGPGIDWPVQLRTLREVARIANEFGNFDADNDLDRILELILDYDLLMTFADDPILGPIVVEQLERMLNDEDMLGDVLDGNFSINMDPDRARDSLEALALLSEGMRDIIEIVNDEDGIYGGDFIDSIENARDIFETIINMGPEGEESSPITITIEDPDMRTEIIAAVESLYADDYGYISADYQDTIDAILLQIFGINMN